MKPHSKGNPNSPREIDEKLDAERYPRKTIPCISAGGDDEKGRSYGSLLTSPELAAYRVIAIMQPKTLADGVDAPGMLDTLRDQAAAVQRGELAHAEAMLINQASALQALFVRLSERAMEQTHMPYLEGFMRLALRAQSQCRATLETLATVKNPPLLFAKQANIAAGPQQVNNGVGISRTRETEIEQSKLSGGTNELLQDAGASAFKSGVDTPLEAMGEIHGTENEGWKGEG